MRGNKSGLTSISRYFEVALDLVGIYFQYAGDNVKQDIYIYIYSLMKSFF